jgi:hypothetical protein
MIRHDGRDWGTAEQLAQALGPDVTAAMLRNWASRDGLAKIRMADGAGRPEVRYPLDQAAEIEARKRIAQRGRPRRLDNALASA